MSTVGINVGDMQASIRDYEEGIAKMAEGMKKADQVISEIAWHEDANSKRYKNRYNELKEQYPTFEAGVRSNITLLNTVVSAWEKRYNEDISRRV